MSALHAEIVAQAILLHESGMCPSHVARALKVSRAALDGILVSRRSGVGERFDHAEARRRRALGAKVTDIARALGVSAASVSRVCEGVVCPVDHRANAWRPGLEKAWAARRARRRGFRVRRPAPVPKWLPASLVEVFVRASRRKGAFHGARICRRLREAA